MNMSMDKPMALNRTEGTRCPQVEESKNAVKKEIPKAWECKYEHVDGQTGGAAQR